MDRTEELAETFPIIQHEATGVDCCGCIVVTSRGVDAELTCNEYGAVVGVINTGKCGATGAVPVITRWLGLPFPFPTVTAPRSLATRSS